MSFLEKSDIELIQLALSSSDLKTLQGLVDSKNMNVRRALARNQNINAFIANKLLFDPVLNISYLASLNPKATQTRVFDERNLTACVKCDIDERKLDCFSCPHANS